MVVRRVVVALVAAAVACAWATSAFASASGVVVSEFRFRGPAGGNDEFVELLNTSSRSVDISGWKLEACNSTGSLGTRLTIPNGKSIAAGGHFLLVNNAAGGYSGSVPGDLTYSTGISDTGVRIVVGTTIVDRVGSTASASGQCREGTGLALPTSTRADGLYAFERRDNGRQDTDNNAADFVGPKASGPANSGAPPLPVVTRIGEIQGAGTASPKQGATVIVEGIVTGCDDEIGRSSSGATFPEDAGIFVQEEPADMDADAATSEGIFVGFVRNRAAYPPGSVVRLQGVVNEKFGFTMINEAFGMEPALLGTAALPAPVDLVESQAESQAVAADGTRAYYESLEGMRVRLPVGVANSGGTTKFGELFLTPGPELGRVFRTDSAPGLLATDADAGAGDPSNPARDPDGSTTLVRADLFDRVENVVGPLAFSFSSYKVMVQPGVLPVVAKGPTLYPYADVTPLGRYQIRVVSFNVENFFPVGGDLDGGAVSDVEYAEKRDRIVDAVGRLLLRPDVVAVQEVVNLEILGDVAARLGGYTAYLAEGNDSRGIDVGFLVKDTVQAANARQLGKSETTTLTDCADGTVAGQPLLFDRPPLALDVTAGPVTFTILTNHFASKSHPDACRQAQAAFVRDRVAEIEAGGGHAIVVGDLNAFEDESALATLQDGKTTLTNLWPLAPADNRYSFAFQGKLQTLDHVLVTDGLDLRVADFLYAHFDNDYYERGIAGDGHKVSDHDPPTLTLSIDACLNGDDRPTVFVGAADTGVPNRDTGNGCTINDLIVEDAPYRNHGQFVSHVAVVTEQLAARNLLSGREKGAIQRAAAHGR